jgi:hypothetical protein
MWRYNAVWKMILALNSLMKEKLGGFAIIDKNMSVNLKWPEYRMLLPR